MELKSKIDNGITKLNELAVIPSYISMSESTMANFHKEIGFNYSKGMMNYYKGIPINVDNSIQDNHFYIV